MNKQEAAELFGVQYSNYYTKDLKSAINRKYRDLALKYKNNNDEDALKNLNVAKDLLLPRKEQKETENPGNYNVKEERNAEEMINNIVNNDCKKNKNRESFNSKKTDAEIYVEICKFAREKNYSTLSNLLNDLASNKPNAKNALTDNMESPLAIAIIGNNLDIIELLLEYNAKFSIYDFLRDTKSSNILLSNINKIVESNPDIVDKVIIALKKSNTEIFDQKNLMHIVYNSEKMPNLLSIFIEVIKDKFIVNDNLESPLSHALLSGKTELVKLLLENEFTAKFSEFDFTRTDNIEFAEILHTKIVEYSNSNPGSLDRFKIATKDLLTHDNLMHFVYNSEKMPNLLSIFIKVIKDKFIVNDNLESPLSHALLSGKTELVKLLLENEFTAKFSKFDFTRTDNEGKFPKILLSKIVEYISSNQDSLDKFQAGLKDLFTHENLMHLLYNSEKMPNLLSSFIEEVKDDFVINKDLESPLSHALLSGKTELINELLKHPATAKFSKFDFTRTDNEGKFPKILLDQINNLKVEFPKLVDSDNFESFTKDVTGCTLTFNDYCLNEL